MNLSPEQLWDKCLALIRENISEQQYNAWFKRTVFESFTKETKTVLLRVPSPFVYEYLEENYVDLLRKVLTRAFGNGVNLSYRIVTDSENKKTQVVEGDEPAEESMRPQQRTHANESPTMLDSAPQQQIDSQLNPNLTFKNYIEGNSNKLPRAIGQTISEHPQNMQFNPFFVFGPSGCGKTHLINAIGVEAKRLHPEKRVLYISARLFEVQYTNAVLRNTINDFINFYQTIDMLIVDDIQEWEDKKGTQNTFFHIFNHLFRNGKRIILASDRPPVELKGMNERLITRFSCGLIAELEKPNVQLCVDILESKIRHDGLSIPEDVVKFIASTANGSVRDLQGVINSLMAYSVVYNCGIDMQLAQRIIKRSVKVDDNPLTVDEIIESVCQHYNVTPANINSRSRKKDFVMARQVAVYLAQKYTKLPASRIGRLVGGRDHSTVIYSCNQVERRMKIDQKFLSEITSIENSFRSRTQVLI
ncbi:chromosomal replication initiator protein DnaA [uncultured Prevotella sp.]|uniref:chromosomal replication initiator protein DnaA n=1 Tax=uncultured Prevotella sp. TaxID=159272 RepID=UPI0027E2AEA6|nr:chromosomal replication initiator protein DnaA [uncultured Prevotella sp.]